MLIRVDADQITDRESFHDLFARAFGFPDFYGRNMDAWIDCIADLDDPSAGMTSVHVQAGSTLTLVVENAASFKRRCPDLYMAIVECAAFVNWRRVEIGEPPVLTLALSDA
ncbi:barstar family protein [Azotobacter beijerinckii]|uniref:barstar family protein n=1 Tax=Azotobacter beijerinckii TaxID=170623 RepID=UPI00147BBD3C|nr:barstar family protein [Azotobacter beijerinckii]